MIPIVIPSYEPDERFPAILEDLRQAGMGPVVVVDDGSGDDYQSFFVNAEELVRESGGVVLHHEVNKGKGRALKTAFSYILENMPDATGCITADSDGQHTVECITKCMEALKAHPSNLVLGVRDFTGEDVPFKSRFGNNLTIKICSFLCGVKVTDTQTGLRGIPREFMRDLLDLEGERFEFETRMLIVTKDKYPIFEVPIKTIYDSKENHQTHFNPVKDSIRIYKIFGEIIVKYLFSSLSSFVIDIGLFQMFCIFFAGLPSYIILSTAAARILSAGYNYMINYKLVFKSEKNHASSLTKYATLALIQMGLSALLVNMFITLLPGSPEFLYKIPVDVCLFILSFYVQRRFVY